MGIKNPLLNIKQDFSRFISAHKDTRNFAAHSHHFWPDVTFEAQQQAWLDAAPLADRKWETVYPAVLSAVKKGIAENLNLPQVDTLCFAPNTHEFVVRLLSCFSPLKPVKILTTDGEFHSFKRQIDRLLEDGLVEVTRIPTEPLENFVERFSDAARKNQYDLVFLSHVFFDSSFVVTPLQSIAESVPNPETFIVIDGYHGYMAIPTDLLAIADRVFYIAGGYKYAMAGEGVCFMHCPPAYGLRPRNTGWYAELNALGSAKTGAVNYTTDGDRFMGATFDISGLYRMRAVLEWMKARGLTVEITHKHVHALQEKFVAELEGKDLNAQQLVVPVTDTRRGNFLTFRTPQAAELKKYLMEKGIYTDYRGDKLRFGFALYHDDQDIEALLNVTRQMKKAA
jgi:selenocysteine lyase/cysteine desulfurase